MSKTYTMNAMGEVFEHGELIAEVASEVEFAGAQTLIATANESLRIREQCDELLSQNERLRALADVNLPELEPLKAAVAQRDELLAALEHVALYLSRCIGNGGSLWGQNVTPNDVLSRVDTAIAKTKGNQ